MVRRDLKQKKPDQNILFQNFLHGFRRNVRTYINITITCEEARSVVHAFERESWSTAAIDVDAAIAFEIMSLHIGGEGLDGRGSCEGAAQGGDEFVQKGLREGFSGSQHCCHPVFWQK